jgi:hypothetical protein
MEASTIREYERRRNWRCAWKRKIHIPVTSIDLCHSHTHRSAEALDTIKQDGFLRKDEEPIHFATTPGLAGRTPGQLAVATADRRCDSRRHSTASVDKWCSAVWGPSVQYVEVVEGIVLMSARCWRMHNVPVLSLVR